MWLVTSIAHSAEYRPFSLSQTVLSDRAVFGLHVVFILNPQCPSTQKKSAVPSIKTFKKQINRKPTTGLKVRRGTPYALKGPSDE